MNKTQERYKKDFKEMFGNNDSDQQSFVMIEKLKNIQVNAYPNKKFKDILKSKLDHMYQIWLTKTEVPRWSIFQIFTVLGSFIFISGILLLILDIQSLDTKIESWNIEIEMIPDIPEWNQTIIPEESMRMMDMRMIDTIQEDSQASESQIMKNKIQESEYTQDEMRDICENNSWEISNEGNLCIFIGWICSYESLVLETENRCPYIID